MSVTMMRKGAIGGITLDAELYERHGRSSQVTRYPVETGTEISDHISIASMTVTIEGIISDSPIEGGDATGRYLDILYDLEQLWRSRSLVTVTTHLKVYQDMAIVNLDIPRDGYTGQAMRFMVDLQQVVKATAQTTSIPADILAPAVRDQGQTGKDMGKQDTTWVDIPVPATPAWNAIHGQTYLSDTSPQLM